MMGTKLHWVDGPWPGRLAMAARPRGGDWLEDEMGEWRHSGVDTLLSLLEPTEEADLNLAQERAQAIAHGIRFVSFPIPDREVPASETKLAALIDQLDKDLAAGRNVALHCRQGIGRTGLVAACLLLSKGIEQDAAVEKLTTARGIPVPETAEQVRWIERYAESLVPTR